MGKLLTFFIMVFAIGTVLSAVMDEETAFAVTSLTADVGEEDTTLQVASTADFLDSGYLWIGDERVQYTGKTDTSFTGVTRGVVDENNEGGTATSHSAGDKVMNTEANVINSLLGYNRMATRTELGIMEYPMFLWRILTVAVPKMITWDYGYLEGDMVLLKYVLLYPISAGFIISLIGWTLPLVRSILPY